MAHSSPRSVGADGEGLAYNGVVMLAIAAKGEECAARMSALVDWFE